MITATRRPRLLPDLQAVARRDARGHRQDRRGGAARARGPGERVARTIRSSCRSPRPRRSRRSARLRAATTRPRSSIGRQSRSPQETEFKAARDRTARAAHALPPGAGPRGRGGALRRRGSPSSFADGREHRADRLTRILVGRLRDHGRRALEAVERVAKRLGAERPFAVGQVLRLVAVRVRDVGEVDVERRVRLEDARRRPRAPRRTARPRRERAVARRVHVREVEDRSHPARAARDLDARRRASRGRARAPSPRRRTAPRGSSPRAAREACRAARRPRRSRPRGFARAGSPGGRRRARRRSPRRFPRSGRGRRPPT